MAIGRARHKGDKNKRSNRRKLSRAQIRKMVLEGLVDVILSTIAYVIYRLIMRSL